MNNPKSEILLSRQIIKTLLYFDIFNYPLKSSEVLRFLGMKNITEMEVLTVLNRLIEDKVLFRYNDLYSVQNDRGIVERRIKGNAEAIRYLALAKRKAKIISGFPFVRAVFGSGSLSKDYMDDKSDLDFFVITSPGRLWIARTILAFYKRIFLFNSHKYFCINYYVDEDHLEIEEKNLFTATELATVIPLYGFSHYLDLHQANSWLKTFFPNFQLRSLHDVPQSKTGVIKKIVESFINTLFPEHLEKYFRNITLRRWKRIYEKEFLEVDFQIAFKSKTYASKNHDKNYQRKIMDLYGEKLKSFDLPFFKHQEEIVK